MSDGSTTHEPSSLSYRSIKVFRFVKDEYKSISSRKREGKYRENILIKLFRCPLGWKRGEKYVTVFKFNNFFHVRAFIWHANQKDTVCDECMKNARLNSYLHDRKGLALHQLTSPCSCCVRWNSFVVGYMVTSWMK